MEFSVVWFRYWKRCGAPEVSGARRTLLSAGKEGTCVFGRQSPLAPDEARRSLLTHPLCQEGADNTATIPQGVTESVVGVFRLVGRVSR